jgi:hypothetical protein
MGQGRGAGVLGWSGLKTAMSDVPPSTNAFDKMMAAVRTPAAVAAEEEDDEPVYTAVLYEARLEHADPSEPLWRVPYFGQAVRQGTAEEVFAARRRQHERDAAREDKDLGLHAVIDRFGPDSMAWRIVSFKSGPRSEMQAWANTEEIRLIDEQGGILRDMDTKLGQTLNLTKGGQGDPRAVWEGIDARRKRAYTKFKVAMAKYVGECDSALVPTAYVDDDEYPLGMRLSSFRQGSMWKGTPWQEEAKAWAQALPKFYWDARESDEWREGLAQRKQERSREAFTKFNAAMAKYVKEHDSALVPQEFVDDDEYPLGEALSNFRRGHYWKGMPWEDEAEEWAEALPKWHWDARESNEYREGRRQRGKEQAANETVEQKADRLVKLKQTMATDASKAKRRKITTDQRIKERRAELERARTIVVPFEKSKKRRAELRAASKHTKPSSCRQDSAVLYMLSEDGKTIRRVNTDGMMRERDIVGPAVDPPSPDAFESD